MSFHRFFLACFLVPLSCIASQAQIVDPAKPQSVVSALQDLGYRAELSEVSTGDPRIDSSIEGSDFRIYFYGCTANENCATLLFSSGFNMETPLSWEVVNRWNRTKLFGRVYLDEENDPFIDFVVEARGGLSQDVFERMLLRWGQAIAGFKKEIDW